MTIPTSPLVKQPASRRTLIPPAATVWGTIRHELLLLGFALMEIALLTPVAMVILSWARYWPAYQIALWLLLVMLLPMNLIRVMSLAHFDLRRQRRILIAAQLLVILISWRTLLYTPASLIDLRWLQLFAGNLAEGGNLLWTRDLSVFLVTILMWWRGIRLAMRSPEIANVGLRLRLGGLIFLPLIIWFSGNFVGTSLVTFVLLFFLASLTVVSLVRAENIEQERSGTAATLNFRWFAVVFGAALAIIIFSSMLAAFISGDSLFIVMGWLSPLWQSLQFGLTVMGATLLEITEPVLELIAVGVQFLARLLTSIFGAVSATLRAANLLPEMEPSEIPTPAETNGLALPDFAGKAVTAAILLGLIALVAMALVRAYRQAVLAGRDSARSQVEREEQDRPGLGQRVLERLGVFRQWRAAASVRRIYRLMCHSAATAGYPRLGTETPYEYLPTLTKVWPTQAGNTKLITEAFIRVRYGEVPETSDELEVIQEAWRQLEATEPNRRDIAADQGPTLAKRE